MDPKRIKINERIEQLKEYIRNNKERLQEVEITPPRVDPAIILYKWNIPAQLEDNQKTVWN